MTWFEIGFASALVGIVHGFVMPSENTWLNFYYVFLNNIAEKHPGWWAVLGGCPKCFSGWFALLSSIALTQRLEVSVHGILAHVWAAAAGIVIAYFISIAWEKTNQ